MPLSIQSRNSNGRPPPQPRAGGGSRELTLPELRLVTGELVRLKGARVQKIHVPSHRTAVFDLRLPGKSLLLSVNAEPEDSRTGVVASRPPAPPKPLAFQGLLRAHLGGARLEEVEPAEDDRWLRLRFSTPRGDRSLIAELFGRDGNLILLDDKDAILGFGLPSSRRDGMRVRGQWTPAEVKARGDEANRLVDLIRPDEDEFPISAAVERLFSAPARPVEIEATRRRLLAPVRAALKRARRTLDKVRADARRAAEADTHLKRGELLKANLAAIRKGDTSVRVVDWSLPDQPTVEIPLDPVLSPLENMQRSFHQHRRLSRGLKRIEERMQEVGDLVTRLEALLQEGERCEDVESLETLVDRAWAEGLPWPTPGKPAPGRAGPAPRLPYREYRSRSGMRIRVGRNARDNDELTLHHSRGNDLWLHARGVPGSHVIIVGAGAKEPDGETILDAATLAAHFSALRGEAQVDVAMTRRQHVRKVKGSAPGSVQFTQDRTILVRVEQERLTRLLASESDGTPKSEG